MGVVRLVFVFEFTGRVFVLREFAFVLTGEFTFVEGVPAGVLIVDVGIGVDGFVFVLR